jgi:GDP-mannose 6-dehydrogenase
VNVSIFGLGYVGTVSAVCLSKHGHRVIGVDTNQHKVDCINKSVSPIVEPGVDQLLAEGCASGRISATTDVAQAIGQSQISLLCVGTPSNANGSLNLEYIFRVSEQIGSALRTKEGFHGIVIRSTVLPGTVRKATEIIAAQSGKVAGRDFAVASNPEFLREGTSIYDFENPPYTVVGSDNEKLIALLRDLYAALSAPFHAVRIEESEILKYACNSFHAVKVTFANEIGAICKRLGIDSHVVMRLFSEDTKLNISPYYLKPGFAFGGSCLPKDVRAVTYQSRLLDVSTPLLDSLMPSNQHQIDRVVEWVVAQKKKNVGILGLSFKHDTDDLRESPIVSVAEILLGKGYALSIYDENVSLSRLIGANRSYIEQEIPHISQLMRASIKEVLDSAEVVLIANKAQNFKNVMTTIRPGQIVYDLVRITENGNTYKGQYEGIGW